jgi:hypothetical protein
LQLLKTKICTDSSTKILNKVKAKPKTKDRTKRKVKLVSSHSDNESDDGPLFAFYNDGPPAAALYTSNSELPKAPLRPGETEIYYEEYIPDVDHG